jgi:UDP-N-acetylmuramyl pentapeptide phosphotransferase/UDP-N-acetylglucosamine-1-phosphate transferase
MVVRVILYLAAFVLSFLIVIALIPPFGKLAFRLDFVDKPRAGVERKLHRKPIPLTASYAIFIGFFVTYKGFLVGDCITRGRRYSAACYRYD